MSYKSPDHAIEQLKNCNVKVKRGGTDFGETALNTLQIFVPEIGTSIKAWGAIDYLEKEYGGLVEIVKV